MRIRWGIPLPGPFYLSGGGPRHRGGGPGCAILLVLAFVIGAAQEYPWVWAAAAVVAAALAAAWLAGRR